MKQDKLLTLGMSLLFLIIFVTFGVIIVMEKSSSYLLPKIEKKLINYLNETYPNIKNDINLEKTTYKNTIYTLKVTSTKNDNLYFNINYHNKKITDTYEEDYSKGTNFLKHITKKIEQEITKKTNNKYKITIPTTLDKYSTTVKEYLLKEKNLENLKIYTLEEELTTPTWTEKDLTKTITTFINNIEEKNITPKDYTLIIVDKKDYTKAIKINNLSSELIKKNLLNSVINDIINNEKSNIKKYNITYEYLN